MAGRLETPVAAAEAPAEGAVVGPVAGVAAEAEEVQPEPSLASDAVGGAYNKFELETKDDDGAG